MEVGRATAHTIFAVALCYCVPWETPAKGSARVVYSPAPWFSVRSLARAFVGVPMGLSKRELLALIKGDASPLALKSVADCKRNRLAVMQNVSKSSVQHFRVGLLQALHAVDCIFAAPQAVWLLLRRRSFYQTAGLIQLTGLAL